MDILRRRKYLSRIKEEAEIYQETTELLIKFIKQINSLTSSITKRIESKKDQLTDYDIKDMDDAVSALERKALLYGMSPIQLKITILLHGKNFGHRLDLISNFINKSTRVIQRKRNKLMKHITEIGQLMSDTELML